MQHQPEKNQKESKMSQLVTHVNPGDGTSSMIQKANPRVITDSIQKKNISKNLIPKPIHNQLIVQDNAEEEQLKRNKGKNMDAESTTQNFINVSRKGDISPRQIETGKSAVRGKKKQPRVTFVVQVTGVQTRRTIFKSIN